MTTDIEQVKRTNPIADVIAGSGVALRPQGGRLSGRCPFHEDGNPSLTVYPETASFYCFGCGTGGDVIDFVRRTGGLGFREALERLGGGEVLESGSRPVAAPEPRRPEPARARLSLDDRLMLTAATELYHETLFDTPAAQRYLESRGIPAWLARRQRLGFSSGRLLVPYLKRRRFSLRRARELGLLFEDESETMAGRLVVPDLRGGHSGWMVGRTTGEGRQPKYRGLALPRPLLGYERGRRRVFVTEGPFDWLTLLSWGLPACALLGTHAGRGVLRLFERARSIVLVMDGDPPGAMPRRRWRRRSVSELASSNSRGVSRTSTNWPRSPRAARPSSSCSIRGEEIAMTRTHAEQTHLVEVVPPRDLEASIATARGMLRAIAGESLALEIASITEGPRWYLRASSRTRLERGLDQLRAAYPQARSEPIPRDQPELDPAQLLPTERAVVVELDAASDPALPLHSDWRHDPDPLAGLVAGLAPGPVERVICRLTLGLAPRRAAGRIRRRAAPAGRPGREAPAPHGPSPLPIAGLLAVVAAGLQGWRWYEAGEWPLLVAGGIGALVGVPLAAALAARIGRKPETLAVQFVEQKLSAPLVAARLEVIAIGTDVGRLPLLAAGTGARYTAYDSVAGGGLRPGAVRTPRGRARRHFPLLLNTDELAGLWHLPDHAGAPPRVRRTTAQRLAPAPGHATHGARVGVSDAEGSPTPVHLPGPLLHRNHLIVAKTRRGKSTLLRHIAARVMEGAASGADETALVVVDPHQDLAEAVLDAVPPELAGRTTYLDFANLDRPVGLNLLDRELFPDRDRTTEHIVTMMNRLWPQNWGPRMEGALRASLLTLLDANRAYPREAQFTLLDVAPLLTDRSLRERVLDEVQDPAVRAWWRDNYDRVGRTLQLQTANPVLSKIGRFTVTEASRLVFGQARSTFDPRSIIRDGGVLVVNTATGTLGEGAASLVGATLINLLGLLIEEQVALPPQNRRRVLGLIDESSTLGAVDYARMLSELGKYGASFVLVTQSLAKLDAIDRNLAPTIFANSDGLTVFGVSAEDARKLTPELGGDIEVPDLVSLPDFTCYARWWDGRDRPAAFSFRVDPPPTAVPGRARAIARRSADRVGRPRELVVEEITRALSERSPAQPASRERKVPEELAEPVRGTGTDPATDGDEPVDDPALTTPAITSRRGNGQLWRAL